MSVSQYNEGVFSLWIAIDHRGIDLQIVEPTFGSQ